MYVYCVYHVMPKSPKTTAKLPEKSRNNCHFNRFQ